MNRKCFLVVIFTAFVIFSITQMGFADHVSVYNCGFPVAVKLDGDLSDWPEDVYWDSVDHDMGWDIAANDRDCSLEFACVADEDYLYIAVKVWDDRKVIDEDTGDNTYMDDSIEIYIDGDNSKSSEYESDVSQITIGRYNEGKDPSKPMLNSWTGMNNQGRAASEIGMIAAVVDTGYVWMIEAAMPLETFGIRPMAGTVIGFNIQLNDDDDGGNTDHKLSWSDAEREGNNASFRNPSVFGELKLVSMETGQKEGASRDMRKEANVIDGVGRLQWAKGMESTYIGALTAAMNAISEEVTYDYLMGISGAAFRLHIHHPGWCPSAPDATCGYNHGIPAMKAMGYKVVSIHSSKEKEADVEKVRNAVVESIDKGYPVIAINLRKVPDWGVIVGYADKGKEFLCRTYYDETEEYSEAEKWPWVVEVIKEKTEKPDQKKSVLESLRIAVEIANAEKYEDYASGFNAYEVWINDLLNDAMFESVEKDKMGSMIHANAWSYSSLGDARSAAIKYLRSISDLLGEESAPHLTKAAEIYEEILSKLKEGFKYAPYPGQLKDGKKWTVEMRHAEAGVLKEVLALEKKAVNELKVAIEKASVDIEKAEAEKVIIDGVDEYRVMDAMFEGVRVIMSYRGEEYSPAYIQGISGGSFRIAGICPCAPTCNNAMQPQDLIKLLGYEMEYLRLSGDDIDPEEEIKAVLQRVKDEIRAGCPVIVWHAFTNAEWDVVCGFDEENKQLIGRGSYAGNTGDYAKADEDRTIKCVDICPPQGVMIIGEKTGQFDARKAEIAALKEAVRHGRSRKNEDKLDSDEWAMMEGILCYDRWISDFKKPDRERGSGDSYCYGIYRSTHKTASEFLNEIAPKYPDAAQHLRQAAEYFAAEADTLYQGEDLLWWNAPKGPDAERNAKAVELLTKARESYASGIEEIELALKVIGD